MMTEAVPVDTSWLQRGGFRPTPVERFDPDAVARANGETPHPDIEPPIPDEVFDPDAVGRAHGEKPPAEVPHPALMRFEAKHGACVASWGDPIFVTIELDRFAVSHDELKAEVVVRYTAPGVKRQLLAPRRVPLLGTRAPSELAKDLSARMPDVRWRELIEDAFTRAIEAHREGEPAVLLDTVPPSITPLYAMERLALMALLTMGWSRPGEGKTWIATAIAVALQMGRADVLGLAPARPMRVLFLDWEQDEHVVAERVRAIAGERVPDIVYLACRGAIWDELEHIQRTVRAHAIEFLIVDSVGMACGGVPPESSEAALRFGTALRRIGLGCFATAHLPKNAVDESAPFGSIFWLAQLRLGWLVKRQQELGTSGFTLGLFCQKANNDRLAEPLGYDVTFDGGRTHFCRRDVRDVPELADKVSLRWRIQHALASGPRLIVDLAEALDDKPDSISRTLRRYAGKDFVRIVGEDNVDRWANLARGGAE